MEEIHPGTEGTEELQEEGRRWSGEEAFRGWREVRLPGELITGVNNRISLFLWNVEKLWVCVVHGRFCFLHLLNKHPLGSNLYRHLYQYFLIGLCVCRQLVLLVL